MQQLVFQWICWNLSVIWWLWSAKVELQEVSKFWFWLALFWGEQTTCSGTRTRTIPRFGFDSTCRLRSRRPSSHKMHCCSGASIFLVTDRPYCSHKARCTVTVASVSLFLLDPINNLPVRNNLPFLVHTSFLSIAICVPMFLEIVYVTQSGNPLLIEDVRH